MMTTRPHLKLDFRAIREALTALNQVSNDPNFMERAMACIPVREKQATEAFEAGDALAFVLSVGNNCYGLAVVADNAAALKARGIYEAALVSAYIGTRSNNTSWRLGELWSMFSFANADKLREVAPLSPGVRFTLYRGVAGHGKARKTSGMSWTRSIEMAGWYARRFSALGLRDPAICTASVPASDIYAYSNERGEDDFMAIVFHPKRIASALPVTDNHPLGQAPSDNAAEPTSPAT